MHVQSNIQSNIQSINTIEPLIKFHIVQEAYFCTILAIYIFTNLIVFILWIIQIS